MAISENPIARKNGLVIQEMSSEVLVYDLETNKAHCLNKSAAIIWKNCDGNNSIADLARHFAADSNKSVAEDFIWLAIEQLNDLNLLEKKLKPNFAGRSRRELIKKVGLSTVIALPVIASLVAPTSVLAATSCACPGGIGDCAAQRGCPQNSCNMGTCV